MAAVETDHVDMIAAFGQRLGMALDAPVVDVGGIGYEQNTGHDELLIRQRLFAKPQRGRTRGSGTGYDRPAVFDVQPQLRPLPPPSGHLER